ncbi:GNAT family N-acetyltransferase [Niastella caeni]|uniref:GNAT family N-acetyltransferase n=1 Tax=Niastella caeni TaxID=2569763 RepID=A0A4V4H1S2_9BACT|nr:GNAT family N-acetyltransferase [Niastella caeni]THU41536.1 GNAT family N-acetyltransferase [Niastella caeni]
MLKEIKFSDHPVNIVSKFPLINAVVSNLQEGRIFGDERETFYFVFHKAAFSYLTISDRANYPDLLSFFLQSGELPIYFHIYDTPADLIDFCEAHNDKINIRVRKRIQLKYLDIKPPDQKVAVPHGFSVVKIDNSNFDDLSAFNLSLSDKFWRSKQDFLNNGFGFVVNNEAGIPVSICYAACVANNAAEIDVATLPAYQKQGLARLVVAKFVAYSLDNGIIPNWDCFEENYGSLKTAESLGFRYSCTYNFLSIFNKTKK